MTYSKSFPKEGGVLKKTYSQISPESLRKTLFLYLAAILFIFSLFLILTIANPIYDRLKKSENDNVYHDVGLIAMAVNEWGRRAMDIAIQITSRTRIRQELEKYNNKKIPLTQLKAFTEPKLSDAMNMSEEIIGITRLDSLGKIVAQCGERLSSPAPSIGYSVPFDTWVSTPFIQNGRHVVIVSAPIITRSKKYIGTDLVLIDLYQLKKIISSKTDSKKNYETILGYTLNGIAFKAFTEIKNIKNDVINDLIKKAGRGQEGITDESPVFLAAYHGLDIDNWGLVILKNKTELYRTLNTRLIYWGLIGIFACIVFLAGFYFLMKPLANRLLLHSDELTEKVKEQTRHFEEEIKERNRTAAELEKIITEHRQTEIALSESEQKYRLLANNVTDVIWSVDMNLHYNYISPSIEKIHGYTPEEVMEISFEQSFTHASHQKLIEIFSREINRDTEPGISANRSAVLELEIRHKYGKIIPVEVIVSFLRDESGFPIGFIGVTRDISDRKQAEHALKKSESKFRSIFDNKGTATCLFEDDRIIKECNPTFEKLSGFLKSEIINKMTWSDFFTKEDIKKMLGYHDQRSQGTGSPPSQYESGFIKKDGEIKTVIINISLLGKERILSLTDITKRKLAETENENLHKKLAQSQKMEAMGCLAGGIAHDFNNILGAIIGFTELAKMDKIDNEKQERHLNRVLVAADRAKDLVHQILTFSRQTEQKIKPLKVEPIIKEVCQLIRASLPSTIEIQSEINSDSLIMGAKTQIHQVVLNLCTNAGHAMKEDGGTLYVGLTNERLGPNCTVNIPDLSTGDYVKISVKDTGHGISPELIERLFEPFFTTKGPGEGTGMGLAVVHGIVKSMKGEIVVESSLGKGSTFSVYLPVVQDMEEADEPKEDALARGCGHILFVDDEPALVDIGELLLKELGYDVTSRTCGIEALEAFKSNPDKFDLVLTDMTMPQMTGEKLAGEIISIRKDIPIIISTGFSSVMTEKKALELGIKGLLMKPFVLSELARVIQKVLDSKNE